jgi:hypothetical protein
MPNRGIYSPVRIVALPTADLAQLRRALARAFDRIDRRLEDGFNVSEAEGARGLLIADRLELVDAELARRSPPVGETQSADPGGESALA